MLPRTMFKSWSEKSSSSPEVQSLRTVLEEPFEDEKENASIGTCSSADAKLSRCEDDEDEGDGDDDVVEVFETR